MVIRLHKHQAEALEKMKNGCILCGGVGSGKSRTGLAYYYTQQGGQVHSDNYIPKAPIFSRSWKPASLPPTPVLPQFQPKSTQIKCTHLREVFEPILSNPIELEKVMIQFRDINGEHEIKSCYGDIRKIVDVFMDYARLLELVNDEWDLDPYHRAVNEVAADKLRAIAKKYQKAIGYDYDTTLMKCKEKQKKAA